MILLSLYENETVLFLLAFLEREDESSKIVRNVSDTKFVSKKTDFKRTGTVRTLNVA
jgi:hypothetical protein